MKVHHILPLASLATAFVVPDAQVFEHLAIEPRQKQAAIQASFDSIKESASSVKDDTVNAFDDAVDSARHVETKVVTSASDILAWGQSKAQDAWDVIESLKEEHRGPPRHPHGPPEDDPHHGPPRQGRPPCHGKPPHHGPHKPSNKTVYQLISESKYTTKLTKLINDFPDLVEKLNGTDANYTIFAPTDKAFEKIPKHVPEPGKDVLEKILSYHVSPDLYPAGRVLVTHTIPTLLKGHHLASEPRPQRLSINVGFKGLTVNFYSRIVAIDIFGSNGVIHGVDSLLLPPPNVIEIIDRLPGEFSTLELALTKTELIDKLNTTDHPGGTFFAPSNFAFKKLGPKINMFLFSKHGQKYLKALLLYHIGTGTTLYSDAAYVSDKEDESMIPSTLASEYAFLNKHTEYKREARKAFNHDDYESQPIHHENAKRSLASPDLKPLVKKGYHHYDLPTALGDKKLNVDVVRYGPYIGMKVNGFSRVVIQDGIAQDGVIQVVSDVLIPPHGPHEGRRHGSVRGGGRGRRGAWLLPRNPLREVKKMLGFGGDGGKRHMSLCEFKARFKGLVEED